MLAGTMAVGSMDVEKVLHIATPAVYRQRREVIPVPKNRRGQNRRCVNPCGGDNVQRIVQVQFGWVGSRVTDANAAPTVDPT